MWGQDRERQGSGQGAWLHSPVAHLLYCCGAQVLHHQQLSLCKHPHIVEFHEVFLTPRYLGALPSLTHRISLFQLSDLKLAAGAGPCLLLAPVHACCWRRSMLAA